MRNLYGLAFCAALFCQPAIARDLYELRLDVLTPTRASGFESYDNIEDFFDGLEAERLGAISGAYTDTSAARAALDIRGLEATASFPTAGNEIRLRIPSVGFDRTFDGRSINPVAPTRDDSVEELRRFLETNSEGLLTDVLQAQVRETPVDPVAGNPNSLTARMGAAGFAQGSDVDNPSVFGDAPEKASEGTFEVGARFGRFSAVDFTQDSWTLPLSYSFAMGEGRHRLLLDMPLTYTDTEGGKTLDGSFGVAFRTTVLEGWTLTPGIRVGGVGSVDLASAAVVLSGSLTSNYNVDVGGVRVSIGNHVAYFDTQSISIADYDVDYDLQNAMLKNGVGVTGDLGYRLRGKPLVWAANVAHTQFLGDELFIESYLDLSASIGFESVGGWNDLRFGVTYQTALDEDFDGFRLNLGYRF